MNDLADINLQGVKPEGEFKDLEIGKYLIRIEDVTKKAAKDKVDENGAPHPDNGKNFMLAMKYKVYGGPDNGHEETEHLNLWHTNEQTVSIAKARLVAIQHATSVFSASSQDFVNKWLIMEVYLNRNNRKAKKFEAAPPSMIPGDVAPAVPSSAYAGAPAAAPAPAPAPSHAQHQHQPQQHQPTGYVPPSPATVAAAVASAAGKPDAIPSWAARPAGK